MPTREPNKSETRETNQPGQPRRTRANDADAKALQDVNKPEAHPAGSDKQRGPAKIDPTPSHSRPGFDKAELLSKGPDHHSNTRPHFQGAYRGSRHDAERHGESSGRDSTRK